jgi:HEPN domain-containing protein
MSVTSDQPDHSEDQPAAATSAQPEELTPDAAIAANDAETPVVATEEGHWLHRLLPEQWLSAADNELRSAHSALLAKQHRAGVTYARRAAGMALNARLWLVPDPTYGRSYMDHLQALQKDPAVSDELRDAARRLLAVPTTAQLVTLGPKGDTKPAEFAARIVSHAQALLDGYRRHRGEKNSDDSTAR